MKSIPNIPIFISSVSTTSLSDVIGYYKPNREYTQVRIYTLNGIWIRCYLIANRFVKVKTKLKGVKMWQVEQEGIIFGYTKEFILPFESLWQMKTLNNVVVYYDSNSKKVKWI